MPRRSLDLGGTCWLLGKSPATAEPLRAAWDEVERVAEWIPACVPGNVQADLVRAELLPDPTYGMQAQAARWVEEHNWWLVRDLTLDRCSQGRWHLVLRGVDYISDVFLNGHYLGRHEGMFSPQVYDVTGLLRESNRLAIRVLGSRWLPRDRSSAFEKLLNRLEARLSGLPGEYPDRRDTLKCQMSFGWDFAPALRTMGIWDDLYLVQSGEVFMRGVRTDCRWAQEAVTLVVTAELDSRAPTPASLRCTLAEKRDRGSTYVAQEDVQLSQGVTHCPVELGVPEPRLWWPWDRGDPALYELTVEVSTADQVVDSVTQTLGLRRVSMEGAALLVNGQRIFARGANWVPADILPGRVSRADYETLLGLARGANMNMLRVWGGGLRERQAFYEECDRLGILVWQEFPFACAFLTRFPRAPAFLALARAEAQAIVRELRHHPCIALWCGGNEFHPSRNRALVDELRQVVAEEDPDRPFVPASPFGGDHHNWKVWHQFEPPAHYRHDQASFASEFGLQAPPDAQALRSFLPAQDLWPPGPSWSFHGAGLEKLWRYAQPYLSGSLGRGRTPASRPSWEDVDLELFVRASQQAQARGLQIAMEHFRRRKAAGCGGLLIWQLNEPWPAISWSLIDFRRRLKPAYHQVRQVLNPILVSLEYPLASCSPGGSFAAEVWVINDTPRAFTGCRLDVNLLDASHQPVEHTACITDVPPDSATRVGSLRWRLPSHTDLSITTTLACQGQVMSTNEYDLAICDNLRPSLQQRLRSWVSHLFTPS